MATAAPAPKAPAAFRLRTPYPDPATSQAIIEYTLDETTMTTITVYDVRGRRVSILLRQESRPAGPESALLDVRGLPQGVYFVRLEAGSKSITRKLSILR